MGTSVHAFSASADMEYTMDLGALLAPAHMWIKLLDWKKNEKQIMERPQEMCCIHVSASINQTNGRTKVDIENTSEDRSTSSVSFPGLWAVSCLPPPHWVSKIIWWTSSFPMTSCSRPVVLNCTVVARRYWSQLQGRPWCSPHTQTLSPAAEHGTGFTFLWICCYYLWSPLQLCKS